MSTDKRIERGTAKRDAILRHAIDVASLEGLDTLTIGRIAADLGISKSGTILHFGSKQELQLAAIDDAARRFVDGVITPAMAADTGLPRLQSLIHHWIDAVDGDLYPGGCFFTSVSAEYHSRPGPIRTSIARVSASWTDTLIGHAVNAIDAGHIRADTDPKQLIYLLTATTQHLIVRRQLHEDDNAATRARRAADDTFRHVATHAGLALLAD